MSMQKFVILGGGVTGCVTAVSLAQALAKTGSTVCVIELDSLWGAESGSTSEVLRPKAQQYSDDAETLSPETQIFHETLGLEEASVLSCAQGSFNLGTHFSGWSAPGSTFVQTYSGYGVDFGGLGFQNFYIKYQQREQLSAYDRYSLSAMAALKNRFSHPVRDQRSILSTLSYGLNLDGKTYAGLLKTRAQTLGVEFISGKFIKAPLTEQGAIQAVELADKTIDGDFFIDCSGADALLINGALRVGKIDWSNSFICNRSARFTQTIGAEIPSATRVIAQKNFWMKSVFLRACSVNTLVFNSNYLSDEEAQAFAKADHMVLQDLHPGHRKMLWYKNTLALGAAAVSLEPLTFSGTDVLYQNIQTFLRLLPVSEACELNAREYHRIAAETYTHLRDYHLCHYALAAPDADSDFWRAFRGVDLPASLQHRLELFRRCSKVSFHDSEMIPTAMWCSLLMGLSSVPERYDPLTDAVTEPLLIEKIQRMQALIAQASDRMPGHAEYLRRYLLTAGK